MPPRRRAKPQQIERSIHFFRADCGADAGGKPLPLVLDTLVDAFAHRPFTPASAGGRYMATADGEDQCAWVDRYAGQPVDGFLPVAVRFARLRRNAVPQTERLGELSPITLPANSSLCETSHLLFLPNNLVGVEFNFFAPRAPRFADYVQRMSDAHEPLFALEQLLRGDLLAQLDSQRALRVFELSIRPSYAQVVAEASPNVGDALAAAAQAGDANVVGVYMKADPRRRSAVLGSGLFDQVKRIARLPGLRDGAEKATVRAIGPDNRTHTLDLLADHLIVKKRMVSIAADSRVVDANSAYDSILEAYRELNEDGQLDLASSAMVT